MPKHANKSHLLSKAETIIFYFFNQLAPSKVTIPLRRKAQSERELSYFRKNQKTDPKQKTSDKPIDLFKKTGEGCVWDDERNYLLLLRR